MVEPAALDGGLAEGPTGIRALPARGSTDITVRVDRGVLAAFLGARIADGHAELQRQADHGKIWLELAAEDVRRRGAEIRAVEVEPDATTQRAAMVCNTGIGTRSARLSAFDTGVDARA